MTTINHNILANRAEDWANGRVEEVLRGATIQMDWTAFPESATIEDSQHAMIAAIQAHQNLMLQIAARHDKLRG